MNMFSEDTLTHYGTPGMKKGVRHWQYPDGRFTPEGKERYFGYKIKQMNEKDFPIITPKYTKFKNNSKNLSLIKKGNKIILSYLHYSEYPNKKVIKIEGMETNKKLYGKGYSKKLYKYLENKLKNTKFNKIQLEPIDNKTEKYYKNIGYKYINNYIMEKKI